MIKIMIVNSKNLSSEKAIVSDVVIICQDTQAQVIKDRLGHAFNASFMSSHIHQFIEVTYPNYEVEDCRV